MQFIAADRVDTVVEVLPANASKGRDVKAAERTTVDYTDGVLRIRIHAAKNHFFGPSGSVEVTVVLPAGSSVEAKAAASEFRGVGRLGDVAFDGAYRQIKIDEASSVRLTEAVRGTVVLVTQSGGISVCAAAGVPAFLDAGTSYGRISDALKNSEGTAAQLDIHATTAYGDIVAHSL